MERHDPLHPHFINSGGTFNQNALSMAAAKAVLDELWSPAQCAHNAQGDALRESINQLGIANGAPLQACGTGSLITLIWQSARQCLGILMTTQTHSLPFLPILLFASSQRFFGSTCCATIFLREPRGSIIDPSHAAYGC